MDWLRSFMVAVGSGLLLAGAFAGPSRPDASLTITHGGTYRGHWQNDDPAVPLILIQTAEPVVIENSVLKGPGALIQSGREHVNVTVRNCRAIGVNRTAAGRAPGRFVSLESFDSVVIENNDLEGTSGIYLLNAASTEVKVSVVANRAHNLSGRKRDGKGGYLKNVDPAQFLQLDQVRHVPNVEIAWNDVRNDPGASAVEDVISIYLSSGTPKSPIRIHDNYIEGAYPADLTAKSYSGGGIMLGDGQGATSESESGYVDAFDNQVINTTNYGIAIAAGHDCTMHNNRIISTGALPDGNPLAAQNVGAYIWNSHGAKSPDAKFFTNDSGFGNVIGWIKGDGRNDWWTPDATSWKDNKHFPGQISNQVLAEERARWEQKLGRNKMTIGSH